MHSKNKETVRAAVIRRNVPDPSRALRDAELPARREDVPISVEPGWRPGQHQSINVDKRDGTGAPVYNLADYGIDAGLDDLVRASDATAWSGDGANKHVARRAQHDSHPPLTTPRTCRTGPARGPVGAAGSRSQRPW